MKKCAKSSRLRQPRTKRSERRSPRSRIQGILRFRELIREALVGWKAAPTGPVDWGRVNVNGSSIALGHPWSATGGRIVASLAREMAHRDASLGLVSICAAGAMAGAAVLERS